MKRGKRGVRLSNLLLGDVGMHYTVEPLYCGHHWAKKMCPGVLVSEVDLYTKVYYWDLGNSPD